MAEPQYKITSLSKEQEAKCPEYVETWTKIGTCTDKADRYKAEKAVDKSYQLVKAKLPKYKLWFESPLAMIYAAAHKHMEYFPDKKDRVALGLKMRNLLDKKQKAAGANCNLLEAYKEMIELKNNFLTEADIKLFKSVVSDQTNNITYGQHEAGWLSFYSFFRNECGLTEETEVLTGLFELAESCGWVLSYDEYCFLSERHEILRLDERGRLHNTDGPAIKYPDGLKMYSVHGIQVQEYIIERPEEITVALIDAERNAEVRRVMTDKFGIEKYIEKSGAKLINDGPDLAEDRRLYGELLRKEVPNDEPIVMLKVTNGTWEVDDEHPEGYFKTYFIQVPDGHKTALDAVAWTYDMSGAEYATLAVRT